MVHVHIVVDHSLSSSFINLMNHVSLHSSPRAVSPVPKPACLKIPWVPLCYRYFPAPKDFDQSNPSAKSSRVDDFRDGQSNHFPFLHYPISLWILNQNVSLKKTSETLWKSWSKYSHVFPAPGKGERAVESSNSECRQALREDNIHENWG